MSAKNLGVLTVILGILCNSCEVYKPITRERKIIDNTFDLRDYTNSGFFISESDYYGAYNPVAFIDFDIIPAIVKETIKQKALVYGDELGGTTETITNTKTEIITYKDFVEMAVKKAKDLGSDGIANLRVSERKHSYYYNGRSYEVFDNYKITGNAIKRK